jgi:hypothetical protein
MRHSRSSAPNRGGSHELIQGAVAALWIAVAVVPSNAADVWLAVVRGALLYMVCCAASASWAQAPGPQAGSCLRSPCMTCGCDICLCSILYWITLFIRKAIERDIDGYLCIAGGARRRVVGHH